MNKIVKILLASLLIFGAIAINTSVLADTPPPPPPDGGHGGGGSLPPGGGTPIGEGIFIFSLLAAGYGGIKTWKSRIGDPK